MQHVISASGVSGPASTLTSLYNALQFGQWNEFAGMIRPQHYSLLLGLAYIPILTMANSVM